MTTNIIEINDSEIRVASRDRIILRSPGYAVVDGEDIMLGIHALQRAYLHPRQTYNRFWSKLNQDALQTPTDHYRHHADLAYAHLMKMHDEAGKPEEIIFAVPGSLSSQQLSLLLGIVEACPFNAAGLVDIAVASAAAVADTGNYVHADIHLYQTVLTDLDIDTAVNRARVEIIDDTGVNTVHNKVSSLIADLFIKQSRFDPLHHAETEQAIHDQLPFCFDTLLTNREVLLEIPYNDTNHQAKLSREHLVRGLLGIYQNISKHLPPDRTVLISDRLASLPGFIEHLTDNHTLKAEDVFKGCHEHELKIRSKGDGLDFVTQLPVTRSPSVSSSGCVTTETEIPEIATTVSRIPSHVLDGHQAWSLGQGEIFLSTHGTPGTDPEDQSKCSIRWENGQSVLVTNGSDQVLVNDLPATRQLNLYAGDAISFLNHNRTFLLISVN